jgi:hypothetical protein
MPKITALPAAAAITADDLFAIVNDPSGVPVTQKATGTQLRTFIGSQIYEGRYPALPDDVNLPALSFPTGGGGLSQWSVNLQAWV